MSCRRVTYVLTCHHITSRQHGITWRRGGMSRQHGITWHHVMTGHHVLAGHRVMPCHHDNHPSYKGFVLGCAGWIQPAGPGQRSGHSGPHTRSPLGMEPDRQKHRHACRQDPGILNFESGIWCCGCRDVGLRTRDPGMQLPET